MDLIDLNINAMINADAIPEYIRNAALLVNVDVDNVTKALVKMRIKQNTCIDSNTFLLFILPD